MELNIRLFGAPRILVDGREVVLPYKKADAVLYYVILKGSATRSRIAELLWPDAPVAPVGSLGPEDPLEKEMATHSSIFARRIPCTKDPGGLQSMGSQRVGQD